MKQSWLVGIFLLTCILAMIHFKFGLQILDVFQGNWALIPCSDSVPGMLSWEYFRDQPWTYPLGEVKGYNAPMTSNLGLTDAIPLMAMLFKLLHPIFGGESYYYFGIWFFISFLLQAFFGYKLLSLFLPKRYGLLALGTLFFLLSPPFLHRFGHHALTIHWTILAAFWIYFHLIMSAGKKLSWQIILTALMAWTHPYAAAMMLGMSATLLLRLSWADRAIKWWTVPLIFVGTVAMVMGLWEMMGYFSLGEGQLTNNDFGFYSANANALFNSMDKTTLFSALPLAKDGQYEGFAFLGTGILGLLALVLLFRLFRFKQVAFPKIRRQYLPLLLFVLLATLFSFSHVWTFGEITFAKMDYPALLAQRFRSSGRFIWFLHYLALTTTLLVFLKSKLPVFWKWSILILAIGIQLYDVSPFFKQRYIRHTGDNYAYKKGLWHPVVSAAGRSWTYPPQAEAYLEDCDYGKLVNIAKTFQKPISAGRSAYYNVHEMAASQSYLEEQLENELADEQQSVFITTFNYYDKFYKLVEKGIVQAFLFEGYLIFVPNKLYQNTPEIKKLSSINEELENLLPVSIQAFLEERADATLLLSVKDDGQTGLDENFKNWMQEKGSDIRQLKFRGSYAAIFRNNVLVTEEFSESDVAEVTMGTLTVESAGRTGGNYSSIKVKGKEFSTNLRGINIVVLRQDTVREVINFDTYRSTYLNRAYQILEE